MPKKRVTFRQSRTVTRYEVSDIVVEFNPNTVTTEQIQEHIENNGMIRERFRNSNDIYVISDDDWGGDYNNDYHGEEVTVENEEDIVVPLERNIPWL